MTNRNYILLPVTSPSAQRPFYVREENGNSETPVYLYYTGGEWRLGPLHQEDPQEYVYKVSNTSSPQHLEGTWKASSGDKDLEVELTLKCARKCPYDIRKLMIYL